MSGRASLYAERLQLKPYPPLYKDVYKGVPQNGDNAVAHMLLTKVGKIPISMDELEWIVVRLYHLFTSKENPDLAAFFMLLPTFLDYNYSSLSEDEKNKITNDKLLHYGSHGFAISFLRSVWDKEYKDKDKIKIEDVVYSVVGLHQFLLTSKYHLQASGQASEPKVIIEQTMAIFTDDVFSVMKKKYDILTMLVTKTPALKLLDIFLLSYSDISPEKSVTVQRYADFLKDQFVPVFSLKYLS